MNKLSKILALPCKSKKIHWVWRVFFHGAKGGRNRVSSLSPSQNSFGRWGVSPGRPTSHNSWINESIGCLSGTEQPFCGEPRWLHGFGVRRGSGARPASFPFPSLAQPRLLPEPQSLRTALPRQVFLCLFHPGRLRAGSSLFYFIFPPTPPDRSTSPRVMHPSCM